MNDGAGLEPDHYAVLGVPENASNDEIRRAYHRTIRQWHPDTRPGSSSEQRKAMDGQAGRINTAYNVLSGPERESYDARLRERRRQEAEARRRREEEAQRREEAARAAQRIREEEARRREAWARALAPTRGRDFEETLRLTREDVQRDLEWTSGIDGQPLGHLSLLAPGRYELKGRGHFGTNGGPRGDHRLTIIHANDADKDLSGGSEADERSAPEGAARTGSRAATVSRITLALALLVAVVMLAPVLRSFEAPSPRPSAKGSSTAALTTATTTAAATADIEDGGSVERRSQEQLVYAYAQDRRRNVVRGQWVAQVASGQVGLFVNGEAPLTAAKIWATHVALTANESFGAKVRLIQQGDWGATPSLDPPMWVSVVDLGLESREAVASWCRSEQAADKEALADGCLPRLLKSKTAP